MYLYFFKKMTLWFAVFSVLMGLLLFSYSTPAHSTPAHSTLVDSKTAQKNCAIAKNSWVGHYFFEGFAYLQVSSFDISIKPNKAVKLVLIEHENPEETYTTRYQKLSDTRIKITYLPKAKAMGEVVLWFDEKCQTYISGEPIHYTNYLGFEQPIEYTPYSGMD